MNDKETTFQEVKDVTGEFLEERDWLQYQDVKNLAEALSIESSELLELFLWKSTEESMDKTLNDPEFRIKVQNELADVVIYAIDIARSGSIDLAAAIEAKIAKNAKKYPVETSKSVAPDKSRN